MKRAGKIDNFLERLRFRAQLDKIDISFDHRLRHALSVSAIDVAEIQDSVEPAIV